MGVCGKRNALSARASGDLNPSRFGHAPDGHFQSCTPSWTPLRPSAAELPQDPEDLETRSLSRLFGHPCPTCVHASCGKSAIFWIAEPRFACRIAVVGVGPPRSCVWTWCAATSYTAGRRGRVDDAPSDLRGATGAVRLAGAMARGRRKRVESVERPSHSGTIAST